MSSNRSRSNSTHYDNSSTSTDDTVTTPNLLKIPFCTRFFLLIKTDNGNYKYVPDVQYSDDYDQSGKFIVKSNRIKVLEASQNDHNVAIGYFGDFVWYYVGKLKNPSIKVNFSIGTIESNIYTNLYKLAKNDFDFISCGLTGTKHHHSEAIEDISFEMCLVCWLYGSTFQFALRPIYDSKTIAPIKVDIISFRGFLRQAFDMLQSMVGYIDELWTCREISINSRNPALYVSKGPFKPLSEPPNCCISCRISYLFLFDNKVVRRPLTKLTPKIKTKPPPPIKKEEAPPPIDFTLANGELTSSSDFVPLQIDFIEHSPDYYMNSHVLLLTKDLTDSFPDATWVHAITKYWHKKYGVVFTHLFESSPILDEAVTNYIQRKIDVDEFFNIISTCKLSNFVRSRQWICRVKCKHIFVCKLPKPFPTDIILPKPEPTINYTCGSCNTEIDHIVGVTECLTANKEIKNEINPPYESYKIDKGPDYTMGASTDDVFNSSMLTPITSIFVTMRSLIPVYAAKNFTWPSSYPLDQINIVREFVRYLQSHWNPMSEIPPDQRLNEDPCFWGLRCSRCYKSYHAKCINPPNARIPPLAPNAFSKNVELKASPFDTKRPVTHVPFYHAESFLSNHLNMENWICSDCSDCAYCGLPLNLEILPDPKVPEINTTKPKKRKTGTNNSIVKTGLKGVYTAGAPSGWPVVRCVSCNFTAHGACCNPVVPMIHFLSFWRCDNCRRCLACGCQDKKFCNYTNWDSQFFFCRSCNYLIGQLNYCAVCYGVWGLDGNNVPMSGSRHTLYETSTHGECVSLAWIQCGGCMLWLHVSCDPEAAKHCEEPVEGLGGSEYKQSSIARNSNYRCPICRSENRQLRYYRIIELLFLMDKNNELRYKVVDSCSLYWRIVKVPINLSQIKHHLERVGYSSDEEFTRDLLFISNNAKLISMPNSKIFKLACNFEKRCSSLFDRILYIDRPKNDPERVMKMPLIRIHSQRSSIEDLEANDNIDEIIKKSIKLLPDYEISNCLNGTSLLDRIVFSLFNNDKSYVSENLILKNANKLNQVLDLAFSQLFCTQRKISSRGFFQHVDVDVCYICKSVDFQNDFVHCFCCGNSAHITCIGHEKSSLNLDKLSFRCANCCFCFYCGLPCNSSHPLEITNISDISFGIKSGWIPKNTAKALQKARVNGVGYVPHLSPHEYVEILYDSNFTIESIGTPIRSISCIKCLRSIHLSCIQKMTQTNNNNNNTVTDSMLTSFIKDVKFHDWRKNVFNNIITCSYSNQKSVKKMFSNPPPSLIEKVRKEGKRFKNSSVFSREMVSFNNGTGQFVCCNQEKDIIPSGISVYCTLCSKLFVIYKNPSVSIRMHNKITQVCKECILNGFQSTFDIQKSTEANFIKFDIINETRITMLTNIGLYKLIHSVIMYITPLDTFHPFVSKVFQNNLIPVTDLNEFSISHFINSEYFTRLVPDIIALAHEVLFEKEKNIIVEKDGEKRRACINNEYIINLFPETFNENIKSFFVNLLNSITQDFPRIGEEVPPLTKLVWVIFFQFTRFYKNFIYKHEHSTYTPSPITYSDVDHNHTKKAFSLLGNSYLKNVLKTQILKDLPPEAVHPSINSQLFCFLCKKGSTSCLGHLLQFHYNNEIKSVHSSCIAWSLKHDNLSRTWNPVYNSLITLQPPLEGVQFKACMFSPSIFPVLDILGTTLNSVIKSSIQSICAICSSVGASVGCYGECGMKYHLPCLLTSDFPLYVSGKTCWCLACWRSTEALRFQQLELLYSMSPQGSIKEDFFLCEGLGGGAVNIVSKLSSQRIVLTLSPFINLVAPSTVLRQKKKINTYNTNTNWGYLIVDSITYRYRYPIGYVFYKRWWHREIKNKRCLYMFSTGLVNSNIEFCITDVSTKETFKHTRLTMLVLNFIKAFKENVSFISSLFTSEDILHLRNFGETLFGFNDPECVRICQLKYLSSLNKRISRLSTLSDLSKPTTHKSDVTTPINLMERLNKDDTRVKKKFDTLKPSMQYRYLQSAPSDRLRVTESPIHGLGLFSNQLIQAGEPIIEYIGELIRDVIGDVREKIYTKRWGIDGSCYMFRLDEEFIVDATRMGNMARFINHSCEPNCVCKIITSDAGTKHIVIFAKRDITAGEEITYNYQFGIESEANKLICHCGAPSCLKRMN